MQTSLPITRKFGRPRQFADEHYISTEYKNKIAAITIVSKTKQQQQQQRRSFSGPAPVHQSVRPIIAWLPDRTTHPGRNERNPWGGTRADLCRRRSYLEPSVVEEDELARGEALDVLVVVAGQLVDDGPGLGVAVVGAPVDRQHRYPYHLPGDRVQHLRGANAKRRMPWWESGVVCANAGWRWVGSGGASRRTGQFVRGEYVSFYIKYSSGN